MIFGDMPQLMHQGLVCQLRSSARWFWGMLICPRLSDTLEKLARLRPWIGQITYTDN